MEQQQERLEIAKDYYKQLLCDQMILKSKLEAVNNKLESVKFLLNAWGIEKEDIDIDNYVSRPSSVIDVVLTLLEEVRSDGLNAAIALKMATARGIELNRGTVSSMLSRLKRDGIVHYDGDKYRLREFAVDLEAEDKSSALEAA